MFKPVKMRKFRTVFHRQMHDSVISSLHEAGVVQLKEITVPELAKTKIEEELFKLTSLFSKYKEIEEFLRRPPAKKTLVKKQTYGKIIAEAEKILKKLEPKVKILQERSENLEQRRQAILSKFDLLEKFRELKIPLQYLTSSDEIKVTVGFVDEEKVKEFVGLIEDSLEGRVYAASCGAEKRRAVIVACRFKDYQKISPILYRFEAELLDIPAFRGLPSDAVKDLRSKMFKLDAEQQKLEMGIKKLAKSNGQKVSQTREILGIQKEKLEAAGLFGFTDATQVIEGWVQDKNVQNLQRLINKSTSGRNIVRTYEPTPMEAESVPIELKNPPGVKDFERITGMYGLPKYDEVDPTPVLAITFPLFFGIALSDAGYGLVLSAFMLSGFWFAKAFGPDFRRIMAVCGISTFLVSLLIGGWFGFGRGLWIYPIEQPIPLLKLVIFIGLAHLLIAFGFVGLIKDLSRRDWKELVGGRLSKVLILLGFFGLGFSILGMGLQDFGINYTFPKMELFSAFNPFEQAPTIVVAFRGLFYIGLVTGIIGAALKGKGVQQKMGSATNVVYGITGLIADVTSYTRLLALGIATGVIALSINTILGFAFNGLWPQELTPLSAIFAGLLLIGFGIAFIAAHSFNIFINCLGGFIHTMRLHFAEFFGKFYESGGEKFSPFKAKREFTKIKGGEWYGR